MSNLKLNNNKQEGGMGEDFNIPSVNEANANQRVAQEAKNQSYVKTQAEPEKRKLFANKKANIALGIVAALIVIVWVGMKIYIAQM